MNVLSQSWTVSNNWWMILGQNLIASVILVPKFKDFREFLFQLLDVHLNCLYIPKRSFGFVVFSRLEFKLETLSYFEVGKKVNCNPWAGAQVNSVHGQITKYTQSFLNAGFIHVKFTSGSFQIVPVRLDLSKILHLFVVDLHKSKKNPNLHITIFSL